MTLNTIEIPSFRLMVLHVYHAGAYNVGAVADKIMPKEGTQD